MSFIPNLRSNRGPGAKSMAFGPSFELAVHSSSNQTVPVRLQAYVDTPQIIYSQWNTAAGGINDALGTLPADFKVCLIGAGISNVVAALELAKAGASVTLIEASNEVGGRTRSIRASDGTNVAELGAMRFPPSEDLLYHYASAFGFSFLPNFPDPGNVPTLLSYRDSAFIWDNPAQIPPIFRNVHDGWHAFINDGIHRDGEQILVAASQLTQWLQSSATEDRSQAIPAWQKYLDTFRHDSFYSGLTRIFGENHEWDVPGGNVWTLEDFSKFGALGLGSGGFGPLYPLAFNAVFRQIPDSLETDQATFAKGVGAAARPAAIQDLTREIWNEASRLGVQTKFNTKASVLSSVISPNGWPEVKITEKQQNKGASTAFYNMVIVGTTTRAMNVGMSLTRYLTGPSQFLAPNTSAAISAIHMTSSTKVFIRTRKFWESQASNFPRNILSDTKAPQLYTLDYGHAEYGMVLLTYCWEELSNQLAAISSKSELLDLLKGQIADIMTNTDYPHYTDHLVPVTADDIYTIHWQLDQNSLGAFTIAYPGQDKDTATMFYDYEKVGAGSGNTGVLVSGDCVSFLGGWTEGGLQASMNALSAILKEYGTLTERAASYAPVNLLESDTYHY